MPKFIAFLRAINVGGHTVTMQELRRSFESLSLEEVETFIASGNVIFASRSKDIKALRKKIESHLLRSLGYEVKAFLRTFPEVRAIAQYKPFNNSQLSSAAALNVAFLADPLTTEAEKSVTALKTAIDDSTCMAAKFIGYVRRSRATRNFLTRASRSCSTPVRLGVA